MLIEKEWIAFGHPFRSRSDLPCDLRNNDIMAHIKGKDSGSRCRKDPPQLQPAPSPVFLLFLTCLHHLLQQFPSAFEYNDFFLLCLARAAAGNSPYGDFLCNTEFERETVQLRERTKSIWTFFKERKQWFRNTHYQNPPYDLIHPNGHNNTWNNHSWKKDVLKPDTGARVITLWSEYYFPKDDYSIALLSAPPGAEVSLLRNPAQQFRPYHLGGFPSEYYLVSLFMKRRKRRIAEKVWTVWRSFVLEKKRKSSKWNSPNSPNSPYPPDFPCSSNSLQKRNEKNGKADTEKSIVESEEEKWDVLGNSEWRDNSNGTRSLREENEGDNDNMKTHVSLAVPQKTIHEMQSKIFPSPLSTSPPTYTPFNDFLQEEEEDEEDDGDVDDGTNLMITSDELCESQFLEWVHLSGQDDDSDTAKILTELLREAQMDDYYCQNVVPESEKLKDLLREAQIDKQVLHQNFCQDTETLKEMLRDAQTENPYLTRRRRANSTGSNNSRNCVIENSRASYSVNPSTTTLSSSSPSPHILMSSMNSNNSTCIISIANNKHNHNHGSNINNNSNNSLLAEKSVNVSKIPPRPIVVSCVENNKSSSDLSSEFVFV